jgi:hypothetical protein
MELNLLEKQGKQSDYKVLSAILDEMEDGREFKGIYLSDELLKRTGRLHYPDSMLRYMRFYRRERGRQIINIYPVSTAFIG